MIKITYNVWPYIKADSQQVAIRVRWYNKTRMVTFITGYYADPEKWDEDGHRAKKNTTHEVRGNRFLAADINDRIALYRQEIDYFFQQCCLQDRIPTVNELKKAVNDALNPTMEESPVVEKPKTMHQLFEEFKSTCGHEKNWSKLVREKYTQSFNHLMSAIPRLRPTEINKAAMIKLRDWYVKEKYKNTTINHRFTVLRAFFTWIAENTPYRISRDVLDFKANLKEAPKTITFLTYEELQHFYHFEFKSKRLAKARDQFCFMAFTSLRISDMRRLMVGNIVDGHIELIAKKTDERLVIPLVKDALEIIERYKDERPADGHLFDVITGQKLNDYIKEAAKEAGLNRPVLLSYYQGAERHDQQKAFHEIISCHDARRTFITCSLALGIPENFVRRCSGHKDLRTMAPYMGVGLEAQTLEMEKWDKQKLKSQIISMLSNASEEQMAMIIQQIQPILQKKQDD